MKEKASGGEVEAPRNLIALELCPSFLRAKFRGARCGLRPLHKLEGTPTPTQVSKSI